MALTATARSDAHSEKPLFTDDDRQHPEARKRIYAKKGIVFHPIDDEKNIPENIAKYALEYKEHGQAILVFLRKLEHVEKVVEALHKSKLAVQTLTGTLRGLERDALAKGDPIFARFMPKPSVPPQPGTVYLVCTSAGEVGVNISADHLVCDLTPFDSMVQRFGRVNRFGGKDPQDARIDVVHTTLAHETTQTDVGSAPMDVGMEKKAVEPEPSNPNDAVSNTKSKKKAEPESPFNQACMKTLSLLQNLQKREDQRYDASPAALRELVAVNQKSALEAFTPKPTILPTSDILFDAWAMTSVRQQLPGRPPVADWLHGVAEWEPPETHVAWREEVECLIGPLLEQYKPEDLLDDYPLKPHELLRDQTRRVFGHLETMAARCPNLSAWVIEPDSEVKVLSLAKLVETDKQKKPAVNLGNCTVILPPSAGGWKNGLLDGNAAFDETQREIYDVADKWADQKNAQYRRRVWDDDPEFDAKTSGLRLIRTIAFRSADDDEDAAGRLWFWYERPTAGDGEGSKSMLKPVKWQVHTDSVTASAVDITKHLFLPDELEKAITLAAKFHDLGKKRELWQRSIGNPHPMDWRGKSGKGMKPLDITDYRHEFGSLLDVVDPNQPHHAEFHELSGETKDLVLHLIAAHHGRARPYFPSEEIFDPDHTDDDAIKVACEVPRRFARLQRKYGRWGLAYLESLVRAADALASQVGDEMEAKPEDATQTQKRGVSL
jgi:CRISPR-associated endonuclease/helicase Cas3